MTLDLIQRAVRSIAAVIGRDSWLVRRARPAYEAFLNWSSRGNGIPWAINGVTYMVDPRQRHRLGREWDAPVARFLRDRVRPGDVCFDVGANVGVYVLQFAHWSRPNGTVIAFEPNPTARLLLERHLKLNGLTERTKVIPAAVGSASGDAVFYAAGADGMSRLGAPNTAMAGRVVATTVSVVTLDGFCRDGGLEPDWLLLDIEGFEIAALTGAREVIDRGRPSLGIVVEMHPDAWETASTSRADAESLLNELGLDAIPLTGQGDPLAAHGLVHLSYR